MRRVIKIGGSLLGRDSLANQLMCWVDKDPFTETIAIVGGGELIEAVRRLDATFACPPEWVHWQCIGLLRTTFEWLGQQLSNWELHSSPESFSLLKQSPAMTTTDNPAQPAAMIRRHHLISVDSFYRPGMLAPLPEDWTTTTDAIAGWLAILLDADELVLLKSCDVDPDLTLNEWAEQGIVDRALPLLAERLPKVRCINFSALGH